MMEEYLADLHEHSIQTTTEPQPTEPTDQGNDQNSDDENCLSQSALNDASIVEYENDGNTSPDSLDNAHSIESEPNFKILVSTPPIEPDKMNTCPDNVEDQFLSNSDDPSNRISLELNSNDLEHQPKEKLISWMHKLIEDKETLQIDCLQLNNELDSQKESFEKQLAQYKADVYACTRELESERERLAKENVAVREDLTMRLEKMMKQYEAANKNKESMVMKYAMGEKEVLIVKKQKETVVKKLREAEKDKEILQGKIKTLSLERTKICATLDNKIQEHGVATRTIDKMKDEISAKDFKIKWGQTKLKTEMDAHKETEAKLDRALAKICKHEEEVQNISEEAEKIVKDTKEGENTRANILDKQLQEHKALLIMERQKYEDVSILYKQIKGEHENLRSSHLLLDTEVTTLRVKTSKYESDRVESEKLFQSLQNELKTTKEENGSLSHQLSNAAVYAEQVENEKLRADFAEHKIQDFESKLEDLSSDLANCRLKEAELLSFTEKLSDKNVALQSQFTASDSKNKLFEYEHEELKSESTELLMNKQKLEKKSKRLEERNLELENKLSLLDEENNSELCRLNTKVSDLLNELQVQRKKHFNANKDTNREVQKLRKKLDLVENQTVQSSSENNSLRPSTDVINSEGGENSSSPSLSQSRESISRASSDTSLNNSDQMNGSVPSPPAPPKSPTSPIYDMPQQVLIERILKLQRAGIKRSEKLDFLEEHVAQLLDELLKKNRIIHHYIMKEQSGALTNHKSDNAKSSKATKLAAKMTQVEIMKHGGIMASVYGSSQVDGTMTLELSLEINKKLQAVLEDTLLKNITLKENLNTLGDEVAKLAHSNSSRKH